MTGIPRSLVDETGVTSLYRQLWSIVEKGPRFWVRCRLPARDWLLRRRGLDLDSAGTPLRFRNADADSAHPYARTSFGTLRTCTV